MRALIVAVALGCVLVASSAQAQIPVELGSQVILQTTQRQGTFTSSSVTISEALAPVGTNWVVLRTDWSDAVAQDPTTQFALWLEFWSPEEGIWRRLAGDPAITETGRADLTDINGRRVFSYVFHKSQLLGKQVRVVLDCKTRFRVGLVVEFYDVY